jgi:PAS domain S-box-containing protein
MAQSSATSVKENGAPREFPPASTNAESIHADPLHILFVEDSDFDCSLLVRLLRQSKFVFEWQRVEDEPTMRAALASRHWDAIISDHNLPHFSSTRALEIYNEQRLDEPFIIVSGEIGEGVAVEAMLAGADDYVLKSHLARLPPALTRSLRDAESRRLRRAAESALRDSEARLRSITSNLPGMVFQIAHDRRTQHWKFEYVSEGAGRILGALPADLTGDMPKFLARISAEDRENLDRLFLESLDPMREIRWQAKIEPDGAGQAGDAPVVRWVELNGSPRASGPDTVVWEGVIMDITPQKEAEEALMRSREDIRALSIHLENVKEEERKAIARDIHDDIGGMLASLKFDISWLSAQPMRDDEQGRRIASMAQVLESGRSATYRIMRDLRPSVLNLGIVAAIEWLANEFTKRHNFPCTFSSNRESISLADTHCTAMFRIGQEALTNIVKHAKATSVRIELFEQSSAVTLEITDNGAGLTDENLARMNRFGIRGMRERAENLGGWLEIHGSPDSGTSVMVSLPKVKATQQ